MKVNSLKIEFNRYEYDPFVDFLKGLCITLVILNHCIPSDTRFQIGFPFWGSPAVPIFLIIQVFHFYKKGIDSKKTDYVRIWKRIVFPFFFVEFLILAIWFYNNSFSIPSTKETVYMLTGGPGAYYPWIYLQFAVLLPLFRPLLKIKKTYILVVFILLSQLAEVICALCSLPEWIYRLLFFRYVFLVYLGYELASKGYVLNFAIVLLSVISIVSVYMFTYMDVNFYPLFYNIEAWSTCHWICYFFIAYFMFFILKLIYIPIKDSIIIGLIKEIGKYSYEIYLFQLLYFICISDLINNVLSLEGKPYVSVVVSVALCIVPIMIYKRLRNVYAKKG